MGKATLVWCLVILAELVGTEVTHGTDVDPTTVETPVVQKTEKRTITSGATADELSIVVHPPVRISPRAVGSHFWWMLRASPSDPNHMVACALRHPVEAGGTMQAVLYGSDDSGETWRTLDVDSSSVIVSEVACALGRDGTVYWSASYNDDETSAIPPNQRMRLRRSDDFGRTWINGPAGGRADATVMVVNPGSTPQYDRIFLFDDDVATRGGLRGLSINGGRSYARYEVPFADPPRRHDASWPKWSENAVTLPDGTIGVLYSDNPFNSERYAEAKTGKPIESRMVFYRVDANGVEIGNPVIISALSTNVVRLMPEGIETPAAVRSGSIAVGRAPGGGSPRLYVAWHDVVANRVRIVLTFSDDYGRTWRPPHVIDDLPSVTVDGRDQIASQPSIAVTPSGVVGVEWNEFDGRCWRFAASHDGGETFAPSVPLNTCALTPLPASQIMDRYLSGAGFSTSDSKGVKVLRMRLSSTSAVWELHRGIGLAALTDSTFRASWVSYGDGEDGLYVSEVRVHGDPAVRNRQALAARLTREIGSKALDSSNAWEAVPNEAVELWFTRVEYDARTREFTVGVILRRPLRRENHWPLALRARRFTSKLGAIYAADADNALQGEGAIWVFQGPTSTPALPVGSQAQVAYAVGTREPMEYSQPRILRFRLEEAEHLKPMPMPIAGDDDPYGGILLADFETYVRR